MAKREIRVTIVDGKVVVDNAGNPDAKKITDELSELAEVLNGNKQGFKIEKHVHTHGGHAHTHEHVGGKTG